MAIDYKKIGAKIKKYRLEKNLSQEQLGELIAINAHHISNIEVGRKYPSLELIISISNVLSVTPDDILSDCLTFSSTDSTDEIYKALLASNEVEREILTQTLISLKKILSDNRI